MAGEAEVDEPLAVEGAGHLLQDADAPLTVLHQLVVGRQDTRDSALDGERRELNRKASQVAKEQILLCCSSRELS